MAPESPLRIAGLFAGIGRLELGLAAAGHETTMMCEWDAAAQRVLADKFPSVPLAGDIANLESIGEGDLVSAGFPCQDLNQAGRAAGIKGSRSGLVGHGPRPSRR